MSLSRRQFLTATAGFALSISALNQLDFGQTKTGTRLILLGTKGGPRVGEGRRNPSTLILVDDVPYVIDCGYGTSLQLIAAGVALNKLRYVFITHHHSDHNLEYGPLVYNAWATGLPVRIDAYGPPGLEHMTQAFFEYMKLDIDVRIMDEGRPDPRKLIFAHDFVKPGIIMQNANAKVTATKVRHPLVKQAFAFRFDTKDRSIVISGDTAYSPELISLAKRADILVHEVMYIPALEALIKRVPDAARFREHLLASHSTPEDVGRVASQAGVKTVVLTHFVPGDDPSLTDEQWTEGVRRYFKGQIIVGKDLMEI